MVFKSLLHYAYVIPGIFSKKPSLPDETVGVVGLGYVGLPLATLFASKGYKVVGYDINSPKIEELKLGIDSTKQVESIPEGMTFTTDPKALQYCSMVFVCVPTSLNKTRKGGINTKAISQATQTIAAHINPDTIVVFESSVYTGLTRELATTYLPGIRVAYSPERVNPGDKVHTTAKITKLVAGDTKETAETVAAFYRKVLDAKVHICASIEVAETAKLFENIQRASLIAWSNELAIYCHDREIATDDVLEACKTKWNFVPAQPGFVAGDCLPVNPYYFNYNNDKRGFHPLKMTAEICARNRTMPDYISEQIIDRLFFVEKLAIFGVAYKENIGDFRMTGALPLANLVDAKTTYFVDPHVNPEAFRFTRQPLSQLDEIEDGSLNVAVLCIAHNEFKCPEFITALLKKMSPGGWIFDLKKLISNTPTGINLWQL